MSEVMSFYLGDSATRHLRICQKRIIQGGKDINYSCSLEKGHAGKCVGFPGHNLLEEKGKKVSD